MSEELLRDMSALSKKLDHLITTKLVAGGAEPPRLVKANSAFDLAKALHKLSTNADLQKLLGGK